MSADQSPGRRLAATSSMAERLEFERDENLRADFAELDAMVEDGILRALRGERVVELGERHDDETVTLHGNFDEKLLAATYSVEAMEQRGAWAIPERETVDAGAVNFAWWLDREPQFVAGLAGDERRKVTLRGNPRAVFVWAALAPIFEVLLIPHELRTDKLGKADLAAQEKAWARFDAMLAATGLEIDAELAPFRPRSGWSRLSRADIAAVRENLGAGWARNATPEMSASLRMWLISDLVDRFYSKAKKSTPTARQVLTKAYWRPMVAFFGGDWLSFLRYLGAEPAANEEIVTSLPEPKIYVGGEERARAAASAAGVDSAEVERMLSSFFGGAGPTSPVERRLEALKRVWHAVDELHATQIPGGRNLWGILDEKNDLTSSWPGVTYGLWRDLFPADLNDEIRELWGTEVIGKAPDRLVTRLTAHNGALDALGPAMHFWHQMSMSAFANTEGLSGQSAALVDAHRSWSSVLDELAKLQHPVPREFFGELNRATEKLVAIEPPRDPGRSIEVGDGLSITLTVQISGGGRPVKRRGYESVRDVITRERRAWAEQHLDAYLRERCHADLRSAAEAFNRAVNAKGKAPTIRQTITASKPIIDRWFGGDVGLLLAAIGQKGPAASLTYERVMPEDVFAIKGVVEKHLGKVEMPTYVSGMNTEDREKFKEWQKAKDHNSQIHYGAGKSFDYIRAWEMLGREPELKEVPGLFSIEWMAGGDRERGWEMLRAAVAKTLAEIPATGFISKVEKYQSMKAKMVRKGSPVRVRWRALKKLPLSAIFQVEVPACSGGANVH